MNTIKELAKTVDPALKRVQGMVRRMVASIAGAKAIWQFTGVRQLDGTNEVINAEVFSGIGFFARPPASGSPEAIIIMVGDGKAPIAVAVRDEKTRQAIAGALAADETALYNSVVMALAKADGTFEIRSKAGIAQKLLTVADAAALKTAISNAAVVAGDGGAAFKTNLIAALASWPAGTSKLKGE